VARVILSTFERPWLLGVAMAGGRVLRGLGIARLLSKLPGRVGFAMAMLASTNRSRVLLKSNAHEATDTGADGRRADRDAPPIERRGTVALLSGCVMEGLLTETNRATERVLAANGYATVAAKGQRCCGALHAHAGDAEAARRLAKANIKAFERANADAICVNAAGCGAMMKDYVHLLQDEPAWHERAKRIAEKVRDVSELLAAAGPKRGGGVRVRVAYDAPCHLVHAQRIATPPVDVLRAIPELELVPLTESDMCCGSAGIYNLVEPETSDVVLHRKLGHIDSANPELVATGNPGCLMQIGAGLLRHGSSARAVHPVDLLDASYRRSRSGAAG
jgi:glycolate oxidase iron-sulfur subunit